MRHIYYNYYEAFPIDLVDSIRENCAKEKLEKGAIGTADGLRVVKSVRDSDVNLLDRNKYSELFEMIWKYAQDANKFAYGFEISSIENVQYSVYDSEYKGKYDWHFDTHWANDTTFDRKISFIIQLSEPSEYKGGLFEIKGIKPTKDERENMNKKGTIMTIPSFLEHRVTPVTEGRRLSLIAWIEGAKFK